MKQTKQSEMQIADIGKGITARGVSIEFCRLAMGTGCLKPCPGKNSRLIIKQYRSR